MTDTITATRISDPLAGTIARRLVVADVENLLGRAPAEASALEWALAVGHLLDAIGFRRGSDMVVIAVNPVYAIHVAEFARHGRLCVRSGPDGADLALCDELADVDFIARRYDEVTVGSGDHEFLPSVVRLNASGVRTTVAALYGSMSLGLRVAAHRTVWVPRTSRVELGLAA